MVTRNEEGKKKKKRRKKEEEEVKKKRYLEPSSPSPPSRLRAVATQGLLASRRRPRAIFLPAQGEEIEA
ncbi:hypothetical protein BHE74_00031783, partial [Ensete ventricosum]